MKKTAVDLRWLLVGAGLALAGCTPLLPKASSVAASTFDSYESAREALEKVVPYRTTFDELKALGFDPQASANVTVIPYPEVVTRLAPHPGVPLEQLEPGVRDCILAQTLCRAYVFRYGQQRRVREGGFWSDFFNFDRQVSITGWRFEGLVVVRNGVVLLRSIGGEPRTDRVDRQHNPLGPLQPAGEAAGPWLLR
ncbi:hypothetical protein [Ramlibacter sp. 2FC]|uniref:hypothetical protein n=1 Tax=Ramlibacter sp. 2FC TaxID=2502188 RepID=UPI0010F943AC|nr:hypothetical protein [Ramlibacter sp. 2FC]